MSDEPTSIIPGRTRDVLLEVAQQFVMQAIVDRGLGGAASWLAGEAGAQALLQALEHGLGPVVVHADVLSVRDLRTFKPKPPSGAEEAEDAP